MVTKYGFLHLNVLSYVCEKFANSKRNKYRLLISTTINSFQHGNVFATKLSSSVFSKVYKLKEQTGSEYLCFLNM